MTTSATCGHNTCRCTRPYSAQTQALSTARIDPDGDYCSRRCEEVAAGGEMGDGACECGHAQCEELAGLGVPPMQ